MLAEILSLYDVIIGLIAFGFHYNYTVQRKTQKLQQKVLYISQNIHIHTHIIIHTFSESGGKQSKPRIKFVCTMLSKFIHNSEQCSTKVIVVMLQQSRHTDQLTERIKDKPTSSQNGLLQGTTIQAVWSLI